MPKIGVVFSQNKEHNCGYKLRKAYPMNNKSKEYKIEAAGYWIGSAILIVFLIAGQLQ